MAGYSPWGHKESKSKGYSPWGHMTKEAKHAHNIMYITYFLGKKSLKVYVCVLICNYISIYAYTCNMPIIT